MTDSKEVDCGRRTETVNVHLLRKAKLEVRRRPKYPRDLLYRCPETKGEISVTREFHSMSVPKNSTTFSFWKEGLGPLRLSPLEYRVHGTNSPHRDRYLS